MKNIVLQVWDTLEKLPESGTMILGDTGQEWVILMYESGNIGFAWEEDDEPVEFIRWSYLPQVTE